jgi:hypothetical protein
MVNIVLHKRHIRDSRGPDRMVISSYSDDDMTFMVVLWGLKPIS